MTRFEVLKQVKKEETFADLIIGFVEEYKTKEAVVEVLKKDFPEEELQTIISVALAKNEFDVLEKLCKPIVKYLHDNYDHHTTVVITDENARVERTELFVPIKTEGDKRQLNNVRTRELVEELKTREGVEMKCAEPHQDTEVSVNGPAVILIVTD